MSVLNENQLLGASGAGGDYEIEQSLRFDDGRETRLIRTPSTASNRKTFTWSGWVKRSNIVDGGVWGVGTSGSSYFNIRFQPDYISVLEESSALKISLRTTQLLRDSSAWYHIVLAIDTTQGTASNRAKLYLNGNQVTSFSTETYPDQNIDLLPNSVTPHYLGRLGNSGIYLDGYLAEVNFIDGQALTADSFGETGTYGEWKPKAYAGTYGTNGFYLPFEQDYTVEGFSTVTYEATQANQYIGGTGFQPDFIWFKNRTRSSPHRLVDAVRGLPNMLMTNTTGAEATAAADGTMVRTVTGFAPDGFTLGMDDGGYRVNSSTGDDIVAWSWDMGGTTASNTNGSITSSVRANTAYGQSIITHTGSGTNGDTIGHGLSQAPDFIINKRRSLAGGWFTQHVTLGPTKYLRLEDTLASTSNANLWFNTAPTSSVISIGGSCNTVSATFVTYAFHSVTGYSKFGSYSGNGSTTGPVVTLGFSPAFVIIKRSDAVEQWRIFDNTRNPTNPVTRTLNANESNAESDNANNTLNFTSTGFQLTATNGGTNASGGTYIYAAFADTREYAYWYDQSGNNNDWTSEGGLTESDVMVDSPTNNFATWNPLDSYLTPVLSEGNLKIQLTNARCRGTIASQSDGKIYFEVYNPTLVSNTNVHHMGLGSISLDINNASNMETASGGGAVVFTYANANARTISARQNGSTVATVTLPNQIAAGDIIAFASDSSTGKVWMAQNNSWLKANGSFDGSNALSSSNYLFQLATGHELAPLTMPLGATPSTIGVLNCGQDSSFAGAKTAQGNSDSNGIGDFYYAPPAGFLALCTANLPSVDVIPSEHFNTVLYTGNGSTQSIAVGFQPDFTWIKSRSAAENNSLFDSVRGISEYLFSNSTSEELLFNGNGLTSFDSDGFEVTGGSGYAVNTSSATYAAWNWKAGGSAVSNTNGSITSSVSANPAAGFSIVSYTGTGANATVGHGLTLAAPEMVIVKSRDTANSWNTWHEALPATNYVVLNSTQAAQAYAPLWNSTAPTSSVFSLGTDQGGNKSSDAFIAYAFHSVDGYSKVGSYTGNGSTDGPFVHCGFKPKFVILKPSSFVDGWRIMDSTRSPSNVMDKQLFPHSSSAEATSSSYYADFVSNGFKLRSSHAGFNQSGGTFIFMAFAENPFKHSNAR